MALSEYRSVLSLREVRRILLIGLVLRVPLWAANVTLTLQVVAHLHESYAAAGILDGCATVALAISGPWRGRRLDRVGLRRAVAPSLVVLAACWSVAPFVGYLPLLILATVSGLFVVPSFSIVRQILIHVVPDEQRRTALSIDSVAVEISFMIGPVLGVLLATYGTTSWTLFGCEFASIAGGCMLWAANPRLRAEEATAAAAREHPSRRSWIGPGLLGVLLAAGAATIVLTGTDVGIVAALRHMGHQGSIGWVLAVWGLGSAIGGIVYGAMRRHVPVLALLVLLSVATVPAVFAHDQFTLAGLLFVAGFFCAPTITATVEALSRYVPEQVRGEALGWHGSALTAGSAAGAPIAGFAIDGAGWQGAFLACAALGLVIAGAGVLLTLGRQRRGSATDGAAMSEADLATTDPEATDLSTDERATTPAVTSRR